MESVATHGFFLYFFFLKFNQQRIFLRTRNIHERQKKIEGFALIKGKGKCLTPNMFGAFGFNYQ